MLARGTAGENNSVVASSVIVMKQSDISERQQREREEWRRGVGGIVKAVDPAAGTITVNNGLAAQRKEIVVHVTQQTQLLRYPANSINFEDAKPGTIDQIKPGDQLNARGTKSEDGTEFTAQAVVSGTFQNVAGTVISTDGANNTVTLNDLATKKPVVVKIGSESQMRKLPEFVAMMIAMRLKGGAAGAAMAARAQGGGAGQGGRPGASGANAGGGAGAWRGNGGPGQGGGGMRGGGFRGNGGPPDFQQMLNRLPPVTLADLKKGDAVMLVSTAGSEPVAIKLLTGVEPILSAAPAGMNAAATVLSPWNLGQAAGGGEGAAGP
jgi:hypothetical protein